MVGLTREFIRYMYGGSNPQYDYGFVTVLSIPLFKWSRVNVPATMARYYHSCNVVGNRQMFVVGGDMHPVDAKGSRTGNNTCDSDNNYRVLDLTAHSWTDSYDVNAASYELNPNLVTIMGGTYVLINPSFFILIINI